jgi:hypothetical protein
MNCQIFPLKFQKLSFELSYDDVAPVLVPCLELMGTPCDANGISIRVFLPLLRVITFLSLRWYQLTSFNITLVGFKNVNT